MRPSAAADVHHIHASYDVIDVQSEDVPDIIVR